MSFISENISISNEIIFVTSDCVSSLQGDQIEHVRKLVSDILCVFLHDIIRLLILLLDVFQRFVSFDHGNLQVSIWAIEEARELYYRIGVV